MVERESKTFQFTRQSINFPLSALSQCFYLENTFSRFANSLCMQTWTWFEPTSIQLSNIMMWKGTEKHPLTTSHTICFTIDFLFSSHFNPCFVEQNFCIINNTFVSSELLLLYVIVALWHAKIIQQTWTKRAHMNEGKFIFIFPRREQRFWLKVFSPT